MLSMNSRVLKVSKQLVEVGTRNENGPCTLNNSGNLITSAAETCNT